jgi:hypothetical protein
MPFTLPLARSTVNLWPYTRESSLRLDATSYLRRISYEAKTYRIWKDRFSA